MTILSSRRSRGTARYLTLLGASLMLAGFAAGCSSKTEAPAAPPVLVTTASTHRTTVPVDWQGMGTVEAMSNVGIRSQVGGILTQVHFTEGQDVRRGDLLFTIDPRPYQAALAASEAQLKRDQALAENAAADAARYAGLVKQEYVTQEDYEGKRSNAAAMAATVKADQAAVQTAQLNLGYCTIRSPLDGRTGSLQVYAGNLIKANADTAMVVIQQMEPIRVAFAVPQQLLSEIRRHDATDPLPVSVRTTDETASAREGELSFIDNTVDPSSGTIGLKATLPNRERTFWPGEFVQIALTLSTLHDAVVAPSAAVQTGQEGTYVYVVKSDDTVEVRPVKVGPISGDHTVIAQGLEDGETVVTGGQLRLYPGAKVEIKQPSAAPSTSGAS